MKKSFYEQKVVNPIFVQHCRKIVSCVCFARYHGDKISEKFEIAKSFGLKL